MNTEISNSKRQLILQAAAAVFAHNGYHQAKVEEIAVQAGIGKGTVYEYFRSKEQLFRETIKNGMNQFNALLEKEVAREVSALARLRAFTRLCVSQTGHIRTFIKITMDEKSLMNDREFCSWVQQMHEKQFTLLEGIIAEGIEKGELRPVNVGLFARLFAGSVGFLLSPFISLEAGDEEVTVEEILAFYFRGIAQNYDF